MYMSVYVHARVCVCVCVRVGPSRRRCDLVARASQLMAHAIRPRLDLGMDAFIMGQGHLVLLSSPLFAMK